jgi:hypothetical protein
MTLLAAMSVDARRSPTLSVMDELAAKQAALSISLPASARRAAPKQSFSLLCKRPAPLGGSIWGAQPLTLLTGGGDDENAGGAGNAGWRAA